MTAVNDNIGLAIFGGMSNSLTLVVPYNATYTKDSTVTTLFIDTAYIPGGGVNNDLNLFLEVPSYDDIARSLNLFMYGPRQNYDESSGNIPLFISTVDIGTSPDTLNGLILWLDAYDSDNFTFSTGYSISGWTDKSTSNNDFTVQYYNPPTYNNALKSVEFTDSQTLAHYNYYLNLFSEYTILIFGDNIGTGVMLGGVSDSESSYYSSAAISALGLNEATKLELESYGLSETFYHKIAGVEYGSNEAIPNRNGLFTVARSGEYLDFYYDTIKVKSHTVTDSASQVNFGSINGYLDSEMLSNLSINEILIYNRKLLDSEIVDLNNHLYTKWAKKGSKYDSISLYLKSETVNSYSGMLTLFIDRPTYEFMPMVVYNEYVTGVFPMYVDCATYNFSGISLYASGSQVPVSGISLFVLGTN